MIRHRLRSNDFVRARRVLTGASAVLVLAIAQAQTPTPSRISGRVTDRQGVALEGSQVTITADGVNRSTLTDREGQFSFEDLPTEVPYTVRADLRGFESAARRGVMVRPGETVTVQFSLGLYCGSIVDYVVDSPLDQLLTTDAAVHIRVALLRRRTSGQSWAVG